MDQDDFENLLAKVVADERYKVNVQYGRPRSGHPEGSVQRHIEDLSANLELLLKRGVSESTASKLRFLIHVHDTFKAEALSGVPLLHPKNHATLARNYAATLTRDADILHILQYHDASYALWKEFRATGRYNEAALEDILRPLSDVDLLLMFTIIDGRTLGKSLPKLIWFIGEVRQRRECRVDESWVDPLRKSNWISRSGF